MMEKNVNPKPPTSSARKIRPLYSTPTASTADQLPSFNLTYGMHTFQKILPDLKGNILAKAHSWRTLDWGLKGCWLETNHHRIHCVVSLSKTLNPLLITGQPR